MSISLHGGAAGMIDIPAKLAATHTSGDWVGIQLDATYDGYTVTTPDLTAIGEQKGSLFGVIVSGEAGTTSFKSGDEVMVRVRGVARAKVDGTADIAVGDPLKIANGTAYAVVASPSVAVGTNKWINSGDVPDANSRSVAASTAVTGTTSLTAYSTSATIAANTLAAGDIVDIWAQAIITDVTGAGDSVFTLRFGGDAIITTLATFTPAANDIGLFHARVQIRTIGASGTWVASGFSYVGTPAAASGAEDIASGHFIASTTEDTTASITVDLAVTPGHASNSSRCDMFQVKIIRPTSGIETLVNDLKDKANLDKLIKGVALEAYTTNSTAYKNVYVCGL